MGPAQAAAWVASNAPQPQILSAADQMSPAQPAPAQVVGKVADLAQEVAAESSTAPAQQSPARVSEGIPAEARSSPAPISGVAPVGDIDTPAVGAAPEPCSPMTASKEAQNNQMGGVGPPAVPVSLRSDANAARGLEVSDPAWVPVAPSSPQVDSLPANAPGVKLSGPAGPSRAQEERPADAVAEVADCAAALQQIMSESGEVVTEATNLEADAYQPSSEHPAAQISPSPAESAPEEALPAMRASAGAAPVSSSEALQPCAAHEELCTADCVSCPDCRMRCKLCRVTKTLSEFQLISKIVVEGEPPLEFWKATCKVCRRAKKAEKQVSLPAEERAAAGGPATDRQQAAAVRDAAYASPASVQPQPSPPLSPQAARMPSHEMPSSAAVAQSQQQHVVAGQAVLRGTEGANGRQSQQQQAGERGANAEDGQDEVRHSPACSAPSECIIASTSACLC